MNDTVTYLLMTREGFGNVYYYLQRGYCYIFIHVVFSLSNQTREELNWKKDWKTKKKNKKTWRIRQMPLGKRMTNANLTIISWNGGKPRSLAHLRPLANMATMVAGKFWTIRFKLLDCWSVFTLFVRIIKGVARREQSRFWPWSPDLPHDVWLEKGRLSEALF